MTLMSVIVAFLFAISLWYLSSNHKVTFVKLKATNLKFLPNRSWHRLIPAGGTFVSATGGTFQSDTPGTFVSAMGGTFDSDIPGTFESATGGTFNPLLSEDSEELEDEVVECEKLITQASQLLKTVREHYLPSEESLAAVSSSSVPASTSRKYRLSEDGRFRLWVIIFLALAVIVYMIFGD